MNYLATVEGDNQMIESEEKKKNPGIGARNQSIDRLDYGEGEKKRKKNISRC